MLCPVLTCRKLDHPIPARCPILGRSGNVTGLEKELGWSQIGRLDIRLVALALRDRQSILETEDATLTWR